MPVMALDALLVLFGCYALYIGGNWLIDGVKRIGADLGWSPALIGLILVSLGTSAPELFVAIGAAIQGYGDIAVGNVIGSNIVNLSLVLGIGAAVAVLPIGTDIARRHVPIMVALTLLAVVLLLDGHVARLEALVLMLTAAVGVMWAVRGHKVGTEADIDAPENGRSLLVDCMTTGLGVLALAIGAESLILGATGLAADFGVSEAVIALTVTSIGTGLPEIVATVIAVTRRETELAIANVVGSNIMNLGLVLGVSGLLVPLNSAGVGMDTLGYLAALSLLVLVLGVSPGRITQSVGALLMLSYGAYVFFLVSV